MQKICCVRGGQRFISNIPGFSAYTHDQSKHEKDFVFEPSDRPGNEMDVNWSLQEDSIGVTMEAFHNINAALLKIHVAAPFSGNTAILSHPPVAGKANIDEAGDNISFDEYTLRDELVRAHLTWRKVFIEDASVVC